jgi:hypothetical protein
MFFSNVTLNPNQILAFAAIVTLLFLILGGVWRIALGIARLEIEMRELSKRVQKLEEA